METSQHNTRSLETWAFRIFGATVFLSPIIFLPVSYIPLELIKTYLIVLGVMISLGLYTIIFYKEKRIPVPPRTITYPTILVLIGAIISALVSSSFSNSFSGIGTELYTVGFLLVLFAGSYVSYLIVSRRPERAVILYTYLASSFLVLALIQIARFILGAKAFTLGVLPSLTSTILGGWYALSAYAFIVLLIIIIALIYLPLSSRMKAIYSLVGVLAFVAMFFINDPRIWTISAIVFLGYALYSTFSKSLDSRSMSAWLKRISWVPVIVFIVSALFVWKGDSITAPVTAKIGASYSELRLPWQMTLDIGANVLENNPLFGIGPNNFTQSYLTYKPLLINTSSVWSTEFSSGSGFLTTIFATEGFAGIATWILFLILIGVGGVKVFRRLPTDQVTRFVTVSSYLALVSGLILLLVSVQPHAILFIIFILLGIFFGVATTHNLLPNSDIVLNKNIKNIIYPAIIGVFVLAGILIYTKNVVAVIDYTKGGSVLNSTGNAVAADKYLASALSLNNSDIFWRGRAQVSLQAIQNVANSVGTSTDPVIIANATSSINALLGQARKYAESAIAHDPTSYYNYISLARVLDLAVKFNVPNAYKDALANYTEAVKYDPYDPALYLEVAQVQASNNDMTSAIQTINTALRLKINYSDAYALLLQIYVAQNDTKNALATAEASVQVDPNNPVTLYQLGVLLYTTNDYANAITVLERAVKLSPNYANAEYFLGLSYARQNRTADALAQFQNIEKSNPNNQDVAYIISALQAGESLFVPPQAAKVANTSAKMRPASLIKSKGPIQ